MNHHVPLPYAWKATLSVLLLTVSIPVAFSQTLYTFTASYTNSQTYAGETSSSSLVNQSVYLPADGVPSGPFPMNLSTSCFATDGGINDWELYYSGTAVFADLTMFAQAYGETRVAAQCLWTTNNWVSLEEFGLVFLKATEPVEGQHWPYPFTQPCSSQTNTSCFPKKLDISHKGPSCTLGVNCPPAPSGSSEYSWDLDGPLPVGHPIVLALVMNVTGKSHFCQIGQNTNLYSGLSCNVSLY